MASIFRSLSGHGLQGLVRERCDPVGNLQLADAQPLDIQLVKAERAGVGPADRQSPDRQGSLMKYVTPPLFRTRNGSPL